MFSAPFSRFFLVLVLLAPLSAWAQTPAPTPAPAPVVAPVKLLPLTDNTQAPYMGIYEGPVKVGIAHLPGYLAWLNRTTVWVHDTIPFGDTGTWPHIAGRWEGWFFDPWAAWLKDNPGSKFILSLPMLPGPPDGSGPKQFDGAGQPVSLAIGATGAYNQYFRELAHTIVASGMADRIIIRLGWEWNGNWYAWKVVTHDDAKNFVAYWQQIVNTMRAEPGAENLKFDWNVTSGFKTAYEPMEAYPGDAYVDYVGIDVYNSSWYKNEKYPAGCFPIPATASEAEVADRHETVWQYGIMSADQYGVDYWQKVADTHHKPLTIPEWGVMNRPDGHAGGDDPGFIQHLYDYIQDPAHNIYFASYFDGDAGSEGDCRIFGTDGKPLPFPKSSALMKKLFSLPVAPVAKPTVK